MPRMLPVVAKSDARRVRDGGVMGWIITCECGYEAPMDDFDPSCADECHCPKCGMCFIPDLTSDDDDDDEEE
jgi:hypothetical protein